MNDTIKTILLWMVAGIILVSVFNVFGPRREPEEKISYSTFLTQVKQGNVSAVTITDQDVAGVMLNNKSFATYLPMAQDPQLLKDLMDKGVTVKGKPPEQPGILMHLLNLLPWIILFAIWIYVLRQQSGGGKGGAFSFGRSRARLLGEDQIKVTFADVAGCEEAKNEVKELVDFLRDPGKFQKLGGKIPQGVLLVGQPGTGKTLLARAVAGEAKVPFFTISGSDFVEMFVGVGASRVRDMFEQAKKQAPCIIFIDEIDAVGRHRGAGLGGGHDEREQTLNQLLVEMDGFQGNEGVIVIAATNRPDVLDNALLRPGRFDRQVVVDLPDVKGREQILRVHMRKVPLADDVEAAVIARGTPGFSGADLANIVNEAALFAARANKRAVGMLEFEKAKDKVIMGSERRSMVMSESEKKLTAYHEAGHAIVGLLVPEHDPVHKVTIIPRGRALGVTMFLPEGDRYSYTKEHLESKISSLFGGRLAEILIFGASKVTTGASNDIQKATELARNMVTKWGLSDKLGPLSFGENEQEVFLGHAVARHKEISESTFGIIDQEVHDIIDQNYKRAETILKENLDKLHIMAEALMKYETIGAEQIKDIMIGRPATEPEDWLETKNSKRMQLIKNKDNNLQVIQNMRIQDLIRPMTKAQVDYIQLHPKKKYFGTDGIRGRVGTWPINAEFILKLGWAVGIVLSRQGGGKVLIGKDTRISGYMFESVLEAGLSAAGVDTHLLGPMPTPAIAYLTRTLRAQAGIVISASHNPYYDNGIKFFSAQGYKLADEVELEIEAQLEKPMTTVDSAQLGKAVRVEDAPGRYIELCKSTVSSEIALTNLKIVVDCANGAGYHIAPSVFRELGADVIEMGVKPNGLNINLDCGAMHPKALQEKVLSEKADIGIALDGDADRVVLIDHKGNILDGDELLYIIVQYRQQLGMFKGGVVGTIMSNYGLELALHKMGVEFTRVPVGDRYIMAELLKRKWQLGGEPSGHVICSDSITTGDGIITALQILSVLKQTQRSLFELKSGLQKYPQALVNVRITESLDPHQKPRIKSAIAAAERELGQFGRVLLRCSGTEPLVRVMVEGKDEARVHQLANHIAEVVREELVSHS